MAIQMTRAEYEAKYGSAPAAPQSSGPIKMTSAQYIAKYGNNVQPTAPQQPTTPEPTSGVTNAGIHKAGGQTKAFIGGAAESLGAGLPLLAIDYLGKKAVNKFGTPEMKENIAKAPTQQQRFESTFGKQENPEAYKTGQITGFAAPFAPSLAKGALKLAGTELGQQAIGKGANLLKSIEIKNIAKQAEKEKETIINLITPKATIKEAKLAQMEGRLIKGKPPTFFKSGTEDIVVPSSKTKQSAETIQRNIPNAHKMNDTDLYTSIGKKTEEIAQNLQPEMRSVQIKPETFNKINKDWKSLKESQVKLADATEEANVRKLQNQFEERLNKTDAKSLDDLWQTRKDYDASVPDNVKNATPLSSESLQNKKELWLQNRRILNDAINDASSGLGEISRKAFSDMHDLYNANQQILTKAKIVLDKKPSKLIQFTKDHPYVSGATAGAAASATGIPQNILGIGR